MQNKLEFRSVYINISLYILENKFCEMNATSKKVDTQGISSGRI